MAWTSISRPMLVRQGRGRAAEHVGATHCLQQDSYVSVCPVFTPFNAGCVKGADGKITCRSDADYISAIQRLRTALPRPYILTTAAWSIGAYGEG